MDKVSIILPAFNAGKTIETSIHSLIHQSYANLEIIVIDDGSTDDTLMKSNSFKDKRIMVVSQPNQGVSVARNIGITRSTGDVIMFLDADDLLHPNTIEYVMDTFIRNSCDIVQFAIQEFTDNLPQIADDKCVCTETITGRVANLRLVQPGSQPYSSVCNKAYRKENIINYCFKENIRYEDEDWLYRVYETTNSICILENKMYFYFINPISFMNSSWNEHKLDFVEVFEEKMDYFKIKDPEIAGRTEFVLCYYFISLYAKTKDKQAKSMIATLYKKRLSNFLKNPYITGINRIIVWLSSININIINLYKIKMSLDERGK